MYTRNIHKKQKSYIYTLVEHQSTVDHFMVTRMLKYMCHILRRPALSKKNLLHASASADGDKCTQIRYYSLEHILILPAIYIGEPIINCEKMTQLLYVQLAITKVVQENHIHQQYSSWTYPAIFLCCYTCMFSAIYIFLYCCTYILTVCCKYSKLMINC